MQNPDSIRIARTLRLDLKQTEQLRAIYEDSFPPSERDDFYSTLGGIRRGKRMLFTALKSGDVVGFAITLHLTPLDIHILEFLAVERSLRNQKIGEKLLRHVLDFLKADKKTAALVLEVESDDAATGEERQLRQRRIAFYERNGAYIMDSVPHYRVPNLAEPGTLDMKLMWLPLKSAEMPAGAALRNLLLSIYTVSYDLAPDNPIVQAALSDLAC